MQQKYFLLALLICSLVYVSPVFAQGPGFDEDVEDTVPLDGGLSLLAAAGVGYGIKKLKEAKKSKEAAHK
jgi:hypothetical protein